MSFLYLKSHLYSHDAKFLEFCCLVQRHMHVYRWHMVLYVDNLPLPWSFQVKMRILMGTYALSAGYYDAYYKCAQQVGLLRELDLFSFALNLISYSE